jgi:hypothetical protein
MNDVVVPLLVKRTPKKDVFLDSSIENPRFLSGVCDAAIDANSRPTAFFHLAQKGMD